jgi:hypothetical protein
MGGSLDQDFQKCQWARASDCAKLAGVYHGSRASWVLEVARKARGVAQLACLLSIAVSALALGACRRADSDPTGSAPARRVGLSATGERRISIAVTADGFVPQRSYVTAGEPVTLVVTRWVDDTCAKDLVLEEYAILAPLPLGEPVQVRFTPLRPGRIRFAACAMNMVAGELVAQ